MVFRKLLDIAGWTGPLPSDLFINRRSYERMHSYTGTQ